MVLDQSHARNGVRLANRARLHEQFNGVTFFRALSIIPDNHINMGADASKEGYGATFGFR